MIGVYEIRNKINGKKYIGSSNNILLRFSKHKKLLNRNSHINKHLQFAWNKYGMGAFVFSILIKTDESTQYIEEQRLIDSLLLNGEVLYNIGMDVKNPMRGRKHTDANKKIISEKSKKIQTDPIIKERHRQGLLGRSVSIDSRNKSSETNKKTWSSLELIKKHSQLTIDRYKDPKAREKASIVRLGMKFTQEHRDNISKARKKLYQDKEFKEKFDLAMASESRRKNISAGWARRRQPEYLKTVSI